VSKSSQTILRKELERLVIELSWKSSRLEGNTYTLLDTEKLIKEKIESKGHPREEAIMILNHKKALDYVLERKKLFQTINTGKIQKIHSLLVKDLDVQLGFRNKKVGIIGTKYKPLNKRADIRKAVNSLCKIINEEKYPLTKALLAIAMLSYIQAFEDGNKRTARILSTAILLAYDYCPVSYRNVDEYDYKKALILFYEQNNIVFLKKLFIEQFRFSVNEYF
jgi:Fic family protein